MMTLMCNGTFQRLQRYTPEIEIRHKHFFNRRIPATAGRVPSQVTSCGIFCGQNVTGADVLRVFPFPLPILIPSNVRYSLIFLSSTLYSLNAVCTVNNKQKNT
jgi:hypothetical protein